ncbi:MAG: HIT family protein [Candidatus Doudnabacteria bacterium]|nr:HIT family protein [Candidatus Doudnabacteria bacterium]
MSDCVFCKIVKWETPSQRVYEDDQYIAFLDINPINPGHTLVIPRDHYENVLDVPEEVLAGMIKIAKKVAPAVVGAMKADGFNIGINNGRASGQLVDHVHIHIIPRHENDNLKSWPSRSRYAEGEMGATAKKIKDVIK